MRFILVLAVITGFAATPAMAHSIQGIWCHKDGRRMEIRDSTIILPRGTTTTGDFWRHYFDYVIPPGEDEAGTGRHLQLLRDDKTVYDVPANKRDAEPIVWTRCDLGT